MACPVVGSTPYAIAVTPSTSREQHAIAATVARTQVYCVGRNYRAHSREMIQRQAAQLDITDDKVDAPPFFFQKPAYGAVTDTKTIPYPPKTRGWNTSSSWSSPWATAPRSSAVRWAST